MKKIVISFILIILASISALFFINNHTQQNTNQLHIVTTIFPAYDFARAVTGNSADLKMLIAPGTDAHNYDPSPKDLIAIKNSDLFIYIGGESETWATKLIQEIDPAKTRVIKLIDFITPLSEETVAGMESESNHTESSQNEDHQTEEEDEHIWTSPRNAIKLIQAISQQIIQIDPSNQSLYQQTSSDYIQRLTTLDQQFTELSQTAKQKHLIFADRFPFRYFTDAYQFSYSAAFPGCAEQTEASASTIAHLIDQVKNTQSSYIFTIELSNQKIAQTIAQATGAQILELHSAHNISKSDFDSGKTYLQLMQQNYRNLKQAIN